MKGDQFHQIRNAVLRGEKICFREGHLISKCLMCSAIENKQRSDPPQVDFRLSTQGRNQIFFRSIFYEKQARDEFQKSRTPNRGLHDVGGPPIRVLGYDPREHWVLWNTNTTH